MYEYMSEFKDVFLMELPNTQSEEALKLMEGRAKSSVSKNI